MILVGKINWPLDFALSSRPGSKSAPKVRAPSSAGVHWRYLPCDSAKCAPSQLLAPAGQDGEPTNRGTCNNFASTDWFKGKIAGNLHTTWENLWFPLDFLLSQSIDWMLPPSLTKTDDVVWGRRYRRESCHPSPPRTSLLTWDLRCSIYDFCMPDSCKHVYTYVYVCVCAFT